MRHILHADFDAFFASVEQLDDPSLLGKAIVVGGSPTARGVVASASYEARKFGIRSAMPMKLAIQNCPKAVVVPPRFDRYRELSQQAMEIFHSLSAIVEPLSLDEAYLDITQKVTGTKTPRRIASQLKARIKSELGLIISVGVGTNKSVSKIASDMGKPDGLVVVPPNSERKFLAPLPVQKLPGVGPKTSLRLSAGGVHTIGDLCSRDDGWLQARLGKLGPHLRLLALGLDVRPVRIVREAKSISLETTFEQNTSDPDFLYTWMSQLSGKLATQLERKGRSCRTVKLKLRLADFTTFTRQKTLEQAVSTAGEITEVANYLLKTELQQERLFRLIGVGVSNWSDPRVNKPFQSRFEGFI